MSISAAQRAASDALDDTLPQSEADRQRTAELSRADRLPPGPALGFDLIRPIGEGAYGSVWLAKERKTGRFAAVKFYTRRGQDWILLGREVEKLAALDNSHHIVGLIDVGWENEPPYYAMEYLPNGSLAAYLAAGPVAPREAVELFRGILRGLVHAHGAGILHCDLKPANVLLDPDFRPRLCDFGQSRLSEEERPALGTLFYMAPEQADLRGLPDVRWDVYAAGAILYHMLTGQPPHRTPEAERELAAAGSTGERLAAYRRLIRRAGPPHDHRGVAGVDKRLAEIVEGCLAPSPADRFPNAQAVLDALDSRDRRRGRLPLIALGLVGPLLLLAAMAPFFLTTMRNAVGTAKSNLIRRALESDALSAHLLAEGLERALHERKVEIKDIADDPAFRTLVEQADAAGWSDRVALDQFLDERRAASDRRRKELGLAPDTSWFLQDADGIQRWRDPPSGETLDKDYRRRDYFHGRGREFPADALPADLAPIRKPHVSLIYRSEATGQYMVAISTPIFAADGKTPIGVLARTQHLYQLLQFHSHGDPHHPQAAPGQVLSLIDGRTWQLVAHPWMTEGHIGRLGKEEAARLRVPGQEAARLAKAIAAERSHHESLAAMLDGYRDPVATSGFAPEEYGGEWLAALRPVDGTSDDPNGEAGWIAVVQERRDAVLAPAERMKSELLLYAVAALAVGGGLIATLWYFVTQALTERTGVPARRAGAGEEGGGAGTP